MKRVLLIACQSQTGQLARVVESVAGPLRDDSAITLDCVTLASVNAYPFPWPFIRFFNTFPETVHERPIPLRPLAIPEDRCYDLVILAYQVWFLSPPPVLSAFLAGSDAAPHPWRELPCYHDYCLPEHVAHGTGGGQEASRRTGRAAHR